MGFETYIYIILYIIYIYTSLYNRHYSQHRDIKLLDSQLLLQGSPHHCCMGLEKPLFSYQSTAFQEFPRRLFRLSSLYINTNSSR